MDDQEDGKATHAVLCGYCEKPVASRENSEGEAEYGCADCDNWDSKEEVQQIAKSYAVEKSQLHLNKAMKRTASRSKGLSFTGSTTSSKTFRFILSGFEGL